MSLGGWESVKVSKLVWEHTPTAKHLGSQQHAVSPVFHWVEGWCWGHCRNTVFLLKTDDIFPPAARSLHCLLKLCYTIYLSTQCFSSSLSADHRDPAVLKPLWSFHRGIWQNVSSISIKEVKGLGKRISNPCNWHHHPPFLSHVAKNQKTCFCLVSIMAKQRDIQSLKLWKSSIFYLLDTLSGGEEWGRHLAQINRGKRMTVVSIFWNESLQNNPTWNDIAKLFALRV